MKVAFLIVVALSLLPQSVSDHPYELKGEAPGITLNQFKANHKHARCWNTTAIEILCRVTDGISFAGVSAETYKGCATPECDAQGLSANFIDGRMVRLSYDVMPGMMKEIVQALKTKFGEPRQDDTDKSFKWKNSVGYLWVAELSIPGKDGRARPIATSIVSALNGDGGRSKDI